MGATVLITRPIDQAQVLATEIEHMGLRALIAPVLEIIPKQAALPPVTPSISLIITSRHAVGWICDDLSRDVPIYVVGESVALALREKGFQRIVHVAPYAHKLIDELKKIQSGQFLYLRGQDVSTDFTLQLPMHSLQEIVVYQAAAVSRFPQDIIRQFSDIDIVTVFSKQSGLALKALLKAENLTKKLGSIKLLCLSSVVLDSLQDLAWQQTYVAATPDHQAMLRRLTEMIQDGHGYSGTKTR